MTDTNIKIVCCNIRDTSTYVLCTMLTHAYQASTNNVQIELCKHIFTVDWFKVTDESAVNVIMLMLHLS